MKIAMIGAGSHVFARRLIADVLSFPALEAAEIALMDLDADRLRTMKALADRMVLQGNKPARITATTDLTTALQGADYVTVSVRASDSRHHITIPERYGINQAVGDTSGPGGVFYFLKNVQAMVDIAQAMEICCPNALMLNYTNPMVMLSWTITDLTDIRYVGLCHSVQGTAQTLAGYIGVPFNEVSYWAAGINHMAWFLEYRHRGKDAYPRIYEAMQNPDVYESDIVKFETLKHFGAFVSESSVHLSEYLPYFRRTPEMIARYTNPRMWGVVDGDLSPEARWQRALARRAEQDAHLHEMAYGDAPIEMGRSHEYCTRIINAIETNEPYVFNGNVPNTHLITNLPPRAVVEVPILADGCGLHACHVGDLPEALAGLNRSNLTVQALAVEGYEQHDRECIYRAIQLDPLTASLLTLDQARDMVDELFAAEADDIPL
ncbi:MAG: alpha-galactosidase [Chloroflexi bacterium]|nr:alpha-galactosidase [Chloroflexota bacterium]